MKPSAAPTPPDLFDICAQNAGPNAFSKAANRITAKSQDRAKIMEYLATVPDATCDEVEHALGMTHQTCSARFSELKMNGLIVATTKRTTRTGCPAQAYKANETTKRSHPVTNDHEKH